MAGIFPSPTGVPAGDTDNGYEPALAPIGGPARFYGRECQTILYYWALNAVTSEILAAVDRLGYAYNDSRVDNLGAALADVIGNMQLSLTAALSDIGDLQVDMTAAEAAISALQSALSAALLDITALQGDITAVENYLSDLEASQVKLDPAIGPYTTVRAMLEAVVGTIGPIADGSFLANNSGGPAPAFAVTAAAAAAMLPLAGGNKGLLRPLSGVTTDYLAGDGEWHAFPSGAIPPGALLGFALTSAPAGWLKANGAAVSLGTYPGLLAIWCGATDNPTAEWGYRCTNPASPSSTRDVAGTYIVLPDRRGEFDRGWDDGRGIDTGRSLWAAQGDLVKGHTHTITDPGHYHSVTQVIIGGGSVQMQTAAGSSNVGAQVGLGTTGITINANTGAENRPRNLASLICVKY